MIPVDDESTVNIVQPKSSSKSFLVKVLIQTVEKAFLQDSHISSFVTRHENPAIKKS